MSVPSHSGQYNTIPDKQDRLVRLENQSTAIEIHDNVLVIHVLEIGRNAGC